MSLNPSRRTWIALAGFAVAAALIAMAAWLQPKPDQPNVGGAPELTEAAAQAEAAVPAPPAEAPDAKSNEAATDAAQASKDPHKPSEPEEPEQRILDGANVARIAAEFLEQGLDGDLDSAARLRQLTGACAAWIPADEAGLERELEQMVKAAAISAERGHPAPPDGMPYKSFSFWGEDWLSMRLYPTEAQNRDSLLRWQRGCDDLRRAFNPDLRRELELLARDGHVYARYLYALWKPESPPASLDLENVLQWQMNAIEFSYDNLREGRVAGLLAFGQSYFEGLFTGANPGLGLGMMNAALACGYEFEPIEQVVIRFTEDQNYNLLQRMTGLSREGFDELTERLSAYCR